MAKLVVSQGLTRLGRERADWLAGLMADQDGRLMVPAWREAMAFDSRGRLGEIGCPTLIIAAANDQAVPIHHARMLHGGVAGSELVVIDGSDHALIWTRSDEPAGVAEEFLAA